jgi:cation diffusion facilitator family transporter
VLLALKLFAAFETGSMAIVASTVDSVVDILAQAVIFFANTTMQLNEPTKYPAGKQKMEPIAVILCASLMGMAALELILQSCTNLYGGWVNHDVPVVAFSTSVVVILSFVVFVKGALWWQCARVSTSASSSAAYALAEDHRNDVVSNIVAIATGYAAHVNHGAWYIDSLGAIVISIYIAINWSLIAKEQIQHVVGQAAPPEFYQEVTELANNHHKQMYADIVRAYHFGKKYLVELEVVLPAQMTVKDSHDIALSLQMELEQLASVERAFVHVDYASRFVGM